MPCNEIFNRTSTDLGCRQPLKQKDVEIGSGIKRYRKRLRGEGSREKTKKVLKTFTFCDVSQLQGAGGSLWDSRNEVCVDARKGNISVLCKTMFNVCAYIGE